MRDEHQTTCPNSSTPQAISMFTRNGHALTNVVDKGCIFHMSHWRGLSQIPERRQKAGLLLICRPPCWERLGQVAGTFHRRPRVRHHRRLGRTLSAFMPNAIVALCTPGKHEGPRCLRQRSCQTFVFSIASPSWLILVLYDLCTSQPSFLPFCYQ